MMGEQLKALHVHCVVVMLGDKDKHLLLANENNSK